MAKVDAPKTTAVASIEKTAVVLPYKPAAAAAAAAAAVRRVPAKATLRRVGRERQAVAAAR